MAEDVRAQMARVASASAWAMGEWSMMEEYSRCIPRDTNEGSFYRAVLAVHKDQHHVAQQVCLYIPSCGLQEGSDLIASHLYIHYPVPS